MKGWSQRVLVVVLFAGLVLALLWFQGLIFRPQHVVAQTPELAQLAPGARTAPVELRQVPRTRSQPGFVEAVDSAPLAARVMANVLAVAVREGDPFEADALLVQLDDRDARARLAQASAMQEAAQAQASAARSGFERVERLLRGGAATTQEWEGAQAADAGAQAALERAAQSVVEAQTALTWFELRAPFAGRVLERRIEPGQLAAPGQPLLTLFRADQLRVRVALPQEAAQRFAPGAECELEFEAAAPRKGRVLRVLPDADALTGAVTLHIGMDSLDGLRPGQLARLALALDQRPALLVPALAVERIGQLERVRVVERGRVTPALVRTGKRHGEFVEVLGGLRAGEVVVLP